MLKNSIVKKSILTTGIMRSNILYSNIQATAKEKNDAAVDHEAIQVYKWIIETELGTFTGICLSIDGVNDEITQLTNNIKILKKNIIPETLSNENCGNKVYTWNVITNSGHASGVSVSLEEAKKVIKSFGNAKVIKSNMLESFTSK